MNNKFPSITVVFDRRHLANINKKGSLEIRVSYNYKQKFIPTGIMLYPNQWKEGKIVNTPDALLISQLLDAQLQRIKQTLLEMLNEDCMDISLLSERLNKEKTEPVTFLDYCKKRTTIRKYGKKKDTQERYDRFLRSFEKWGRIKKFEDITDENIIMYDKFLADKGLKPYSKWNNYHRFVESFILDALDEGYLRRNPYKWLNIPKKQESLGLDRCLTPQEFRKLKVAKMPTESLERVRDLFVFQTYTCLRYSDLRKFDPRKVQEIKGMPVYLENSVKTNKRFTIPLLSPAIDILHKYEGRLPIISNVKYNLYLKSVAQAAGIDKPISTHWARHTGATILLNEGVDMKIVSRICGHSSTRITEKVYAKLMDETVVNTIKEKTLKL